VFTLRIERDVPKEQVPTQLNNMPGMNPLTEVVTVFEEDDEAAEVPETE